jgi:Ca2+-binding EF-hand superfamily protein
MIKHGKGHFLDFSDEEIMKLKECFDQLDEAQKGSISEQDLYDPLIGLGFAETMEDVKKMVELVDDDRSGQIEFPEFLMIIKGKEGDEQCAAISKFFKGLSDGEFSTKAIMFTTYVNQMRRNYLLEATRKKAPDIAR